jgi:F-type H+-transporting ATPase subunit a
VSFSLTGIDWSLFAYVWTSVVLTALIAWLLCRRASAGVPSVAQSLMETVFDFIGGLAHSSAEMDRDPVFLELLVMIFLFLLVANFQGMIPGLHSPTSNLNMTATLALSVFVLMWFYGFRTHGLGYFSHWLHPGGMIGRFMLPINIIEDFSKPLTLAFRLFGNILVGEIFMAKIASAGIYFFLGGFVAGFVWWGFTAFVNVVQAFIFMILTLSYVAQTQSH